MLPAPRNWLLPDFGTTLITMPGVCTSALCELVCTCISSKESTSK
jgi:hypothetical protein